MFVLFFHLFLLPQIAYCSLKMDIIKKTSDNYGPFREHYVDIYHCRGPKAVNLSAYETSLHERNGSQYIYINITFFQNIKLNELQILVYTKNENRLKLIWSYSVPEPCQHFMVARVLQEFLNHEKCIVKKGSYVLDQLVTGNSQNFFGPSFFYGDFVFKVRIMSKNGNLLCLAYNISITKLE